MPIPEDKARISLRVYPNAIKNEIVGLSNGVLCVKLLAPPVKGKANREIIAFLSRLLGTKRDSISIIKGHNTRSKVIVVDGLSREHILAILIPGQGI